jgi:signal transduction histidine kinase
MMIRLPHRINAQIAVLLFICVAFFHAAVASILLYFSPGPTDPRRAIANTMLSAIVALNSTPTPDRARLAAALNERIPELNISFSKAPDSVSARAPDFDYFDRRLPIEVKAQVIWTGEDEKVLATLQDGQEVTFGLTALGPNFVVMALITIGFVGLTLVVFSIWAALGITRPLINFANAVESFSLNATPAEIEEAGSEEVRIATRAFNRMQRRIKEMVDQRTRMLAAVSHDLRTPITRMRLRAEFIEDVEAKAKILRDLDQMLAMVRACLSYLRDGARQEFMPFDLTTLLHTVVDQSVDLGADVQFAGESEIIVNGNPDELERAFSNLVDNAVKFAGKAELAVVMRGETVAIEVADHGPGIPPETRQAMLEPFRRGSENPTLNTKEGFGLGLAIARAIFTAHHGRLELCDREGGGLVARVELPLSPLKQNHTNST